MQKTTWQHIAEGFTRRIESGELAPGTRIETEEVLAARLGVPRHKVHRALQELQMKNLIVRQRRRGTVVAHPREVVRGTKRVAYLVDFSANSFQANILTHIEEALGERARLVVATTKNDPEREAEQLFKLRAEVDGIICYPTDGGENARHFQELGATGYPLVLIDRAPRGCEELVVLTDNEQATRDVVADLIARGHERIAFFSTNNDRTQSIRERFAGFRGEVARLGYATRPYERWVPVGMDEPDGSVVQMISDALAVMRALPEPPTAAFCTRDFLAIALVEACAEQGLEVGVDFSVATFNDLRSTAVRYQGRLDRVVQPMETIGEIAVQRLFALMEGEAVAPGPIRVAAELFPAEDARAILASSLVAPSREPTA